MSVFVVLGTRPEIIKLGPVVAEFAARGVETTVIHTGQHYDDDMSATFLSTFGITVDTELSCGGLSRGAQIGRMTEALSELFAAREPALVVVQGDTNSALAGALAANASGVPLLHVEAGLRSFDRAMPEEHNRVAIDVLADRCAAPTALAAEHLSASGVPAERIAITGNTVLDAISVITTAEAADRAVGELGLDRRGLALATVHRPENTDDPERLRGILVALAASPVPVVFPLHPRTANAIDAAGLGDLLTGGALRVTAPLPYARFLALLSVAGFAVSDSGGIQEEVTAFGVPLLVVRDSTERPEVLETFAERISGADAPALRAAVARLGVDHADRRRELAAAVSPYASPDGRPPSAHVVDVAVELLARP